jgi:hypothetical protein
MPSSEEFIQSTGISWAWAPTMSQELEMQWWTWGQEKPQYYDITLSGRAMIKQIVLSGSNHCQEDKTVHEA